MYIHVCMCMCIYIYIIHTDRLCTYCIHVGGYVYMGLYKYTYTYIYIYIYLDNYVYVCVHIYIYIYIYTCTHICVGKHIWDCFVLLWRMMRYVYTHATSTVVLLCLRPRQAQKHQGCNTGVYKINARSKNKIMTSSSPPAPPKFKVGKRARSRFYEIGCLLIMITIIKIIIMIIVVIILIIIVVIIVLIIVIIIINKYITFGTIGSHYIYIYIYTYIYIYIMHVY